MKENIYSDEQDKIEQEFERELELTLKIADLLDRYGYAMSAELEDGVPTLKLIKLS